MSFTNIKKYNYDSNEDVYIFGKNKSQNFDYKYKKTNIDFYIRYIDKLYNKIIKYNSYKNLYIFGTTIESAFITSILKKEYFILC